MADYVTCSVVRPTADVISKRVRDLKIGSFSDIHLGHPQTPTELIIRNLRTYGFPDNAETGELDLILMGGDLFDGGLSYTDVVVDRIEEWMLGFFTMCARRHIVVRWLEGTPSHDRKQSRRAESIIAAHSLKLDFKYVTEISVECIESLGISILYVPDFTSPDADKIWLQVQQALAAAGKVSVDYANVHGSFTYQLPPIAHVQSSCHSMDRYLSIVDNYIFTAHVHLFSIHERIISNGSFDRLNHGEEGDKGHWRAHIRVNGEDDFAFKINRGAKIYHTIDITGLPLEDAFKKLESVGKLPVGAAVRLELERGHPILTNMNQLKVGFPHVTWSTKTQAREDVQKNLLQDLRGGFTEVTLTPENITDLLMARVRAKSSDHRITERAAALLGDYRL